MQAYCFLQVNISLSKALVINLFLNQNRQASTTEHTLFNLALLGAVVRRKSPQNDSNGESVEGIIEPTAESDTHFRAKCQDVRVEITPHDLRKAKQSSLIP